MHPSNKKTARRKERAVKISTADLDRSRSTLTGFKTTLRLVDDVETSAAANDLIITMALFQRLERVFNFHDRPNSFARHLPQSALKGR